MSPPVRRRHPAAASGTDRKYRTKSDSNSANPDASSSSPDPSETGGTSGDIGAPVAPVVACRVIAAHTHFRPRRTGSESIVHMFDNEVKSGYDGATTETSAAFSDVPRGEQCLTRHGQSSGGRPRHMSALLRGLLLVAWTFARRAANSPADATPWGGRSVNVLRRTPTVMAPDGSASCSRTLAG